jgi:Heparinase II/III-like protein/Heparinase II/III N-terminus
MSLPEIGHRAGRLMRVRLERFGLLTAMQPPAPAISDESRSAAFVHLAGIDGRPYQGAADRLIAGRSSVFAKPLDFTGRCPDWNRDPLTGISAPLIFGKAIDYRDERLVGNIKYLWEPNRHLELVTLAQAWALSEDERYLYEVGRWIDSWLTQCAYPMGPNWASSLEAGIRLINWSLAWQLIGRGSSPLFAGERGRELLGRWLRSVYQHVHFIRHYYSLYSSANNHLVGEAAGLFVATRTWPYWEDFESWGREAQRLLIEAARVQNHPDGVNREQAIAYQQYVLDFFLISALASRNGGTGFPDEYWRTIESMIGYIHAVMDVAGNVPMIGDADDGFAVRLSQEPGFSPYRSLLATGAILFDCPRFATKSGGMDDKTRFLLGDGEAWRAPSSPAGERAGGGRREFPEGGYYILGRDLDTEDEIRLLVDAGPLGYLSLAAHGHADALSFVLSVAGREILVDPGTYSYHTEAKWRRYFRGTGAHNTVRVDGCDQSVQGGNFLWLRHARSRCRAFGFDAVSSHFAGEHDGYARLADPVIHARDILHRGNVVEVVDRLLCDGPHVVERCWHFSEECRVTLEGSSVIAEHGPVRVTLRPVEAVGEVRMLKGSEDPPAGWISRRFDVKSPTNSVYFVDEIRGTSEFRTRIHCEVRCSPR